MGACAGGGLAGSRSRGGLLRPAAVWSLGGCGSSLLLPRLGVGCWWQGVGGRGDAPASGVALRCVVCSGGGSAVPLPSLHGHHVGFLHLHFGHGGYCLQTAPVRVSVLTGAARGGRLVVFTLLSFTPPPWRAAGPAVWKRPMSPGGRDAAGAGGQRGGGLAGSPLSPPHPPVSPLVRCPPVGGVAYVACVRPSAGSLGVRPACVVRAPWLAGHWDHFEIVLTHQLVQGLASPMCSGTIAGPQARAVRHALITGRMVERRLGGSRCTG